MAGPCAPAARTWCSRADGSVGVVFMGGAAPARPSRAARRQAGSLRRRRRRRGRAACRARRAGSTAPSVTRSVLLAGHRDETHRGRGGSLIGASRLAASTRASSAPISPRKVASSGVASVRIPEIAASGLPGRPITCRPSGRSRAHRGAGPDGDPVDDPARPGRSSAVWRKSTGPAAVPPVVTTTSAVASRPRRAGLEGVGHVHRRNARPPTQAIQPGSIGPSASRTPVPRSPRSATRHRAPGSRCPAGDDGERVVAAAAAIPSTAGVTSAAGLEQRSPAADSHRAAGCRDRAQRVRGRCGEHGDGWPT